MSTPVRQAIRTGRYLPHNGGTIHEVLCPECKLKQYHDHGMANCIYCDLRFRVIAFELIRNESKAPVLLPDKSNKENLSNGNQEE